MSSMRGTSNLLNVLPKRYASAAASAQAKPESSAPLPREPVRVSKLSSGIKVASLENHSPISRVAAVVNVGSRDEAHNQQGAAHALRVFSSLATRNYSLFGLSRTLNQIGAELTVTSNREQTTYLLESTRNHLSRGIDILAEIISRPELRFWEINDAKERLEFDLDVYDEKAELRLVDLIHRAAFRNGLSRSLYAPRFNVSNLNSELLQEFRSNNVTANQTTLIGVGVNHQDLLKYTDLFRLPEAAKDSARQQSKYLGSEIREDNLSDLVHLALAYEGVSSSSSDALASAIVSHAFGTGGPRVKYSMGASKIEKSALSYANQPAAVSSFNANYSDAGLLGFHVVANKSDAGKLVTAVYKELVNAATNGFTEQEILRAKNSLKLSASLSLDSSQGLIDSIAQNPDNANNLTNVNQVFNAIDAVSASTINALLKKIASGKPSLAAIGDLSEVPRIDELVA